MASVKDAKALTEQFGVILQKLHDAYIGIEQQINTALALRDERIAALEERIAALEERIAALEGRI